MDDEDLAQRVQSLPPELFNIILAEVFTPDTTTHKIDANYKPPKFLAVSRTTRDTYAKAYYGGLDSSLVFELAVGKPIEPLYHRLEVPSTFSFADAISGEACLDVRGGSTLEPSLCCLQNGISETKSKGELDAVGLEIAEDRLCVKFYGTDVDGQAFVCRA